ncbi:MAG TPA: hypothetical protein VFW87_25185 [Pirellulales bacterium]|nr:hypothetical protein [Pirellulales bacterium]
MALWLQVFEPWQVWLIELQVEVGATVGASHMAPVAHVFDPSHVACAVWQVTAGAQVSVPWQVGLPAHVWAPWHEGPPAWQVG